MSTCAGSGTDASSTSSVTPASRYADTAPGGTIAYQRGSITVEPAVAQAIVDGRSVVVIHGVDYNGNGMYDTDSAGASELDPSLPAEATDPATCGRLRLEHHHH